MGQSKSGSKHTESKHTETSSSGTASAGENASNKKPSIHALVTLTAIGAINALWALFLWGELVATRAGATAFCALGGKFDCSALWDGDFASSVHGATHMPIAGWGLVYGLVTFALPLFAVLKQGEGKSTTAVVTAIRLTALAGAVSLVGLIGVSAASGMICIGCIGTYVAVSAYAIVALFGWRELGFDDVGPAFGLALGATAAAFLLLLYPGANTPKSTAKLASEAIAAAGQSAGAGHNRRPPPSREAKAAPQQGSAAEASENQNPNDPTKRLTDFLGSVPQQLRQGISTSLAAYKIAMTVSNLKQRTVLGDKDAKLTITEWTDARCGHCAQLHMQLEEIHKVVDPSSFNVVPRHFPLDGTCNPNIQRKSEDGTSCIAAKAEICLESQPDKLFEYAGELFKNQQSLTPKMVYDLGSKHMDLAALKSCVASSETAQKLADDIADAMKYDPEGTPLVAINGKKADGFGPFLFAMILTGGKTDNPAFQMLPKPQVDQHVH